VLEGKLRFPASSAGRLTAPHYTLGDSRPGENGASSTYGGSVCIGLCYTRQVSYDGFNGRDVRFNSTDSVSQLTTAFCFFHCY